MECNRREFLSTCGAAGAFVSGMNAGQRESTPAVWASAFPALRQRANGHPLTYLDSAATTLRPQAVINALVEFYSTDNANPSPVHALAARAAQRLGAARETVAKFVNAAAASEIIFIRGTTEGMNLVASSANFGSTFLSRISRLAFSVSRITLRPRRIMTSNTKYRTGACAEP
jgi:selenocysteine lyase/cysteine desulfurase